MTPRTHALIPCLLCALLAAAACSKKGPDYRHIPDAGVVADGGVDVIGSPADAENLNPIMVGDTTSQNICDMVFNGLTRYNPKLQLEGALARSWDIKDGGRTIIFHLRRDVRWQDGRPFTSADVAFTVERVMDPKVASPMKSNFDLVSSLETPDPWTVVARYRKAFAPALEAWAMDIIPKHLLEGQDMNKSAFSRHPVGTGPYRFKSWTDKQSIELAANPDYWEGKVHIARLVMRFIPEPSTELLELKTGGIDGMDLQPDQYLLGTKDEAFDRVAKAYRYPGLHSYNYLAFNLARPPFDDVRVRWALSSAVDRGELIQGVLQGLAKPCSGPFSPLMQAYDPSVLPVPLDLTKSARLLDEAGWRLGADGLRHKGGKAFEFQLITNSGNPTRIKTAEIMQQQFAKLGVKADIRTYEWATFLSNYIDKRNFDATLLAWNITLDPDQYSTFHSSQTHDRENNFVGLKDAEVDRLVEAGRTTFDPDKRTAIYRALHRRIAALQPYAFLYAADYLSALSRKFQGLVQTDTGYGWYSATHWYIPASVQLAP
jgi:peptide/nickel transport system substrate-binding protein